mmetsp:Transcript_7419/g.8162  ORF Transcript_7419/g.8162 Transcript_7419/m.8162 type:complete len:174 (+) Transcript_7419:94-615(+)
MLWLQHRRLTIARRSKDSRMVFSTTFLSASLVGMLLISWMNVIRNGNFPSVSSNNDSVHLFIVPQVQQSTSVINIPATTIPHSIDKVKHQNSTLIDSLKRDSLGLQQRSNPRLPETTDYLIQLSLEHDAKKFGRSAKKSCPSIFSRALGWFRYRYRRVQISILYTRKGRLYGF